MKIHRFIGNYNFLKKEIEITNLETIKQIKTVLRLKNGDKIILSDGNCRSAEVRIASVNKNEIICEIEKLEEGKDAKRRVNLYLAILKKENFELAVQKAVECGVSNIIPIITERTIKTGLNFERLEKIILEASEQSGRSIVPKLLETVNFKNALEHGGVSSVDVGGEKIIFHFVEKTYLPDKNAASVSIFIGPEGGFTDKEINLAKDSGYTVASLGEFTLRGETAAIIATYRTVNGV